jgi:uncharacterized protein YbjT (DUF2867 family)
MNAFQGSHGVYLLTPMIVPPATHEAELGRQLADAAVEAGVQHVIFSSLEDVEKITGGKKWVPHFTDKAKVEEYIRSLPISSSFIYLALFYTNLIEFFPPRMDGDTLISPIYLPEDFRRAVYGSVDCGGSCGFGTFTNRDKYAGKSLPVIGDIISPKEMVQTFSRVTGKKAAYRSAFTREELLHHFPSFRANELFVREIVEMLQYIVEDGYYRKERDLLWSRQVNPNSVSWEQFLRMTKWQGQSQSFGVADSQREA